MASMEQQGQIPRAEADDPSRVGQGFLSPWAAVVLSVVRALPGISTEWAVTAATTVA